MQRPFYIPVPVTNCGFNSKRCFFCISRLVGQMGQFQSGKKKGSRKKIPSPPSFNPEVTRSLTTWHCNSSLHPRSASKFYVFDVLHSLSSPPSFSLKSQVFQCFRFRPYPRSLSKTHKNSHLPMFCTSVIPSFTL